MNGIAKREPHRWLPGESGNPAGRPVGARQKLAEAIIRDICEDWNAVLADGQRAGRAALSPAEKRAVAEKLLAGLAADRAKLIEAVPRLSLAIERDTVRHAVD